MLVIEQVIREIIWHRIRRNHAGLFNLNINNLLPQSTVCTQRSRNASLKIIKARKSEKKDAVYRLKPIMRLLCENIIQHDKCNETNP